MPAIEMLLSVSVKAAIVFLTNSGEAVKSATVTVYPSGFNS